MSLNRRAAFMREMRKRLFSLNFRHSTGETLVREFDEPQDDEIEAISAEIGASGARRPPSE